MNNETHDSLRNTIQALSEANEAWSLKVKSLEKSQAPPDQFKPDWDAMAVMVEEQQRMAMRIEDLEAMLERQTARIVDLQTHIENFDGDDR